MIATEYSGQNHITSNIYSFLTNTFLVDIADGAFAKEIKCVNDQRRLFLASLLVLNEAIRVPSVSRIKRLKIGEASRKEESRQASERDLRSKQQLKPKSARLW
ncbi:hypothetical protein V1478_007490 [Vespula squamosa]|uniref:Uncharacterized protein n=1 Tax=Vespula squamosa TaxID=30214 RepID=A0ABD2B393_VESSQ